MSRVCQGRKSHKRGSDGHGPAPADGTHLAHSQVLPRGDRPHRKLQPGGPVLTGFEGECAVSHFSEQHTLFSLPSLRPLKMAIQWRLGGSGPGGLPGGTPFVASFFPPVQCSPAGQQSARPERRSLHKQMPDPREASHSVCVPQTQISWSWRPGVSRPGEATSGPRLC